MRRIAGIYRDMKLWKKMLIGYAVVIVLPFILFIAALASGYNTNLNSVYLFNEQRGMQQECGNLTARLSLLKSYHLLFQNDKTVSKYMNRHFRFIGDEIVSFLTDIRPLFAYISASAPDVAETTVYCLERPLVPLPREMVYRPETAAYVDGLAKDGRWFFERDGGGLSLKFQAPLYSAGYASRMGMFELTVDGAIPAGYISDARDGCGRFLMIDGDWYGISGGVLDPVRADSPLLTQYLAQAGGRTEWNSFSGKGILVNRVDLPELNAELVSITSKGSMEYITGLSTQGFFVAVLFALLSALYYLIISSFAKRLHSFSKHISRMDYGTLTVYGRDGSKDEIGRLVNVYNKMIVRIKELVSDLNIAELKKREADYFTLQAQMRPHFLYNSLETARMMADSNGDEEVSNFLYNLGGFIRYSFASVGQSVSLATELEIVGKYLSLYKASMGDVLDYEIKISGDISHISCPSFIVQPLVENCLRHGIGPGCLQICVKVSATKTGGKAVVEVSDNGKGITEERLKRIREYQTENKQPIRGGGLGISNTKKRLEDYFKGSADFEIESAPGLGTVCTITISGSAGIPLAYAKASGVHV